MKPYLFFYSQPLIIAFQLLFLLQLTQGYSQDNVPFHNQPVKESLQAIIYPTYENPLHVYIRLDNYNQKEIIQILVKDKKNKILYSQYVKARKYNVKFNMENLPNGTYIIEVSNRTTTYSQQIDIKTLYEQKVKRITAFDHLVKYIAIDKSSKYKY